ncbi:uncharacterized membrane protein YebE (DUF533 family) [Rhodobium orientis]|uniref:Protein YebE n=1 Tax=Rhodobium orientis TaxID=34017 RepID=A0A327JJK9_9HYPH|nr:DUF533 domain-containing protein [Rhodobium orientis]MBB4304435.1 uncharacterized membrane protein YebE (DUF533 family) [Rhodobium orientis]MBK5949960.1 hypothetical protein [Rhodobium orientis]RAI25584.1 hypothetical protein CH339_17445 [Rhodobium orientis]
MFDAKKLLDQFMGTGIPGGGTVGDRVGQVQDYSRENPLKSGLAAGGLAGLLLGTETGRSLTGSAATVGGLALLGGLAYKAYQNWQGTGSVTGAAQPRVTGPAEPGPFDAPKKNPFAASEAEQQEAGLAMVTAMIAAAKSDGHIDATEQQRIFDKLDKLDKLDLDVEAKAFVMDELRSPLDIDKIVAKARTPELAMQIYTASRVAIDLDHPAEKSYLDQLVQRLGIDRGFVNEVEAAITA